MTSKSFANAKHWCNWVAFCSGSDCKCSGLIANAYSSALFLRAPSHRSVLKVQKYISTATCQVKGARITTRRQLTGKPEGAQKKGLEKWEEVGSAALCRCVNVGAAQTHVRGVGGGMAGEGGPPRCTHHVSRLRMSHQRTVRNERLKSG